MQDNANASSQNAQAVQTLTAKDLLYMCVSRWYWFVISLALCCGFAVYHLLKTPPVYERTAKILIKNDRISGTSGGDVGSSFTGMGFLQSNTNVLNEIVAITSPTVMYEVVKRLGLDVNYSTPGMFHDRTLYGSNLPVSFAFPELGERESVAFTATLSPDGSLQLTDFTMGTSEFPGKQVKTTYAQVDTISSPIGKIAVLPNPRYTSGRVESPLEIKVKRTPLHSAALAYAGSIKAETETDYSSVISLSHNDVSTERAEDLLQTLIDVYNENWIRDKNQIAVSTSEFIKDRLAVIESELGNVDSDISSYKSAHMVPDIEQASQLYFNRAAQASDEVAGLNNRLSMANYIRSYLTNSANSFNVLPANAGLENFNIESQIQDYNKHLLERNNLVENSSTSNPLVVDLDNQLAGMRQAILQSIDNYVVTLKSQVRTAESSRATASVHLQANPTQARYLLSVERQQKVKESLYLYLLQKREENELSQAFTAYNTRVITPPMGSGAPVAPNRRNVMLVAILMGLLIPVGLIYITENFNTRVRGRKDLDILSVPFMGEIPLGYKKRRGLDRLRKAKADQTDRRVVMVKKGVGNIINEAFRVIRTNLELMTDAEAVGARTIMVTSANPGSGKTFITMNLATVLAIKDKRVCVVDLDLRKASLSGYAGSPAKGLSALLSGHATLEEIMVHNVNGTEGLDLVPVGALPPNPSEMLYSTRLKTMLEKLKSEYDYVILDCPPVEVVADAKIIARYADMTIFIIRAGLLERAMLPEIEQMYDQGIYHNMAVILNGTESGNRAGLYSRYGYGYGYGYVYGYGSKKKS